MRQNLALTGIALAAVIAVSAGCDYTPSQPPAQVGAEKPASTCRAAKPEDCSRIISVTRFTAYWGGGGSHGKWGEPQLSLTYETKTGETKTVRYVQDGDRWRPVEEIVWEDLRAEK
jgi:hypothetical protein